jgi:ATP-binding cassette subfamily C protein CydC
MAVSGWFIAAMAVAGAAGVSMNYFTPAAVIRACAILRTGGRYGERLITHDTTLRLLTGLRVWFYDRLEPLAPARLQRYRSGDLLSRICADIDTLDQLYLRMLVPMITALAGGLVLVLFLLNYNLRLALILLAFLLMAGVGVPWLTQRLGDAPGRRALAAKSDLRTVAVDGVQGLAELQAHGAGDGKAELLGALSRRLANEQEGLSSLTGLSQALLGLAVNLALWLVVWTAVPLVEDGSIPPPGLAMLALFTLAAFEAVAPLPGAFQALGEMRAAAERVLEVLDAAPEVPEPATPASIPRGFDIRFDRVVFTYPGASRPALSGIELDCPEGARVGIMGPTGSGKSTLVSLLLRFWAPDQGSITLGRVDIARLRGEDLRRRVAVVCQHTHLFTGSIRENLLLANREASPGQLEHACRAAEIHRFVASLPNGYDTQVGENGLALSGGQARRLSIARAILKDAPILVLDEPTEGLDGPTARALMATLDRVMEGRTVLLITHRPEGVERMDEILFLDQGRVVIRGDHWRLYETLSTYRELWQGLDETPLHDHSHSPGSA